VRALLSSFSTANPTAFHAASGEGYRLQADAAIAIDAFNRQTTARIMGRFACDGGNTWGRRG
jgi:aminopeptidase N